MKLVVKQRLESLLTSHWADFLDKEQLLRVVLETARDADYKVIEQQNIPPRQIKLSVTKFNIEKTGFEVWIEFTVPKDNGVVVGTHVLSLDLSGKFRLNQTYGTFLRPTESTLKQHPANA